MICVLISSDADIVVSMLAGEMTLTANGRLSDLRADIIEFRHGRMYASR